MTFTFRVQKLTSDHDRRSFKCGNDALDRYLIEQSTQDVRRNVTACFVACRGENPRVVGFYTIAMGSVALGDFPAGISRKLPRYPTVPVARIGRLAVDLSCRGEGLGSVLLLNAIARALRSDIAAFAVIVDAKDEIAAAFYRHHGFSSLEGMPAAFFLPLGEAARRIGEQSSRAAGGEERLD